MGSCWLIMSQAKMLVVATQNKTPEEVMALFFSISGRSFQ
jgi:hypothetical protein